MQIENADIATEDLLDALAAILHGEHDLIANTANMAALLFQTLPDVNWAGFYFLRGDTLVLGPFQGADRLRAYSAGTRRLRHRGHPAHHNGGAGRASVPRPYRV